MKIKNLRVENENREDLQGDSKLLCLKKKKIIKILLLGLWNRLLDGIHFFPILPTNCN